LEPSLRREQILEHAAALFGRKGYHSTSIANIIQSAGIARGTFYLYFKNKKAIFEELLDYLVVQIKKRIKTVDTSPGSPSAREQVLDNITRVIELLTDNRALLAIMLERAVGLDRSIDEKLSGFYEQIAHTIELSLRLGQEMEIIRPCNTRVAALSAVGALKEVLHDMLRRDEDSLNIRDLAGDIIDVFLKGVQVEGASIP
jgi:AcrR family transcriptional regulator